MLRIRKALTLAAAALALAAAVHTPAAAQPNAARWRSDTRNQQLIDNAVRYYGFSPRRLTADEVEAINDAWVELLGSYNSRQRLNRTQAVAIVYMALVHPYEEEEDDGYRLPAPGGGVRDVPPLGRGGACLDMERDAYQLGNLVSAPERNTGLFVMEPDRGRARTLARQIQERAVTCRATAVADRAGEVMAALSTPLPPRDEVGRRVDVLKQAIRIALQDGRPRNDH